MSTDSLNQIKLTVIVLCYNHEKYITKCLKEVFTQTFIKNTKVVVLNDHSTDNSLKLIKESINELNQSKQNIKIIDNQKNIGAARTLVKALNEVEEDYFIILEGDDYWNTTSTLETLYNFMQDQNTNMVAATNQVVKDQKLFDRDDLKPLISFEQCLDTINIPHISTRLHKTDPLKQEFLEALNKTNYPDVTDWLFTLKAVESTSAAIINRPLSHYRIHKQGFWSQKSLWGRFSSNYACYKLLYKYFKYRKNHLSFLDWTKFYLLQLVRKLLNSSNYKEVSQ